MADTYLNSESLFRGWQLLCVLLVTFPPSKNLEEYLRGFIHVQTVHTQGRIDVMAKYSLHRLRIIAEKGPRGKPPSCQEIESASVSTQALSTSFYLSNQLGRCVQPLDIWTIAGEHLQTSATYL